MRPHADPAAAHDHVVSVASRWSLLVVLGVLLWRFVAGESHERSGEPDVAALKTGGLVAPPTFDGRLSARSALRTMHAFVLWFDEAVIGEDGY